MIEVSCQGVCFVVQSRGSSGGSSGLDDESTTTGIIIIAVVCCVVGTSLVWVIIIYQTRKRHEMYSATPTGTKTNKFISVVFNLFVHLAFPLFLSPKIRNVMDP